MFLQFTYTYPCPLNLKAELNESNIFSLKSTHKILSPMQLSQQNSGASIVTCGIFLSLPSVKLLC